MATTTIAIGPMKATQIPKARFRSSSACSPKKTGCPACSKQRSERLLGKAENENIADVAGMQVGSETIQSRAHQRIADAHGDVLFTARTIGNRIAGYGRSEIHLP